MKNWFYHFEKRPSPKNGEIRLVRRLGAWTVEVEGTYQTSSYTNDMWADACKRVARLPEAPRAKNALLLGLGGGGAVKALGTRFPGVEVTAVEHDPTMVDIAKDIRLHAPFPFPRVRVGDVRDVVPELADAFDLILLDTFSGREPSPAMTDAGFLRTLRERLAKPGVLIANVSGHREVIALIARAFPEGTIWTYRANTLGAFW